MPSERLASPNVVSYSHIRDGQRDGLPHKWFAVRRRTARAETPDGTRGAQPLRSLIQSYNRCFCHRGRALGTAFQHCSQCLVGRGE
jgi:hypothetical protein